jgi:hypothetical protein
MDGRQGREGRLLHGRGPQFGDTGKRARAWKAQARQQQRMELLLFCFVLFETAHSNNGSF